MRQALRNINNFYSPDVLFEDSMARCPWEAGVNVDDDEEDSFSVEQQPQVEVAEVEDFHESESASHWSHGSDSEMVFVSPTAEVSGWTMSASHDATCTALSTRSLSPSPSPPLFSHREFDELRTPSGPSTYSAVSSSPSIPSPPVTPGPDEMFFGDSPRRPHRLTLDIEGLHPDYYAGSVDMLSARSSTMQTALESAQLDGYGPYSAFYITESEKTSAVFDSMDEMGMMTDFDEEDVMDAVSAYSFPTVDTHDTQDTSEPMSARPESPVLGLNLGFPSAENTAVDSPSFNWSTLPSGVNSEQPTPAFSFLTFATTPDSRLPSFSDFTHASAATGSSAHGSPYANAATSAEPMKSEVPAGDSWTHKSRLLNPVRLAFTRRSRSRSPSPDCSSRCGDRVPFPQPQPQPVFTTHWTLSTSIAPDQPRSFCTSVAHPSAKTTAVGSGTSTGVAEKNTQGIRRRGTRRRLRSARDWFSPGKLFAAVMPSPQ